MSTKKLNGTVIVTYRCNAVRELYRHSDRIVISTNGFFTDRIINLCKEFPQVGIRISIEGLEQTNNEIRGLQPFRNYSQDLELAL